MIRLTDSDKAAIAAIHAKARAEAAAAVAAFQDDRRAVDAAIQREIAATMAETQLGLRRLQLTLAAWCAASVAFAAAAALYIV